MKCGGGGVAEILSSDFVNECAGGGEGLYRPEFVGFNLVVFVYGEDASVFLD